MAKFSLTDLLNGGAAAESNAPQIERKKGIEKIEHISVYDLVPSERNFYSVDDLADLKTSIEIFGVKQNLNVEPLPGGKFKVIAGHRRRLASLALVEEGKREYEFVPCAVEEKAETAVDDILQRLLLITTNSTPRQLSDWEKIQQAQETRALLEELKAQANIPGRLRDLMAEVMKMSAAQIGRMEAISHNLSEPFKGELRAGRINMSTAYELSGLSGEQQAAAFEEYEERGAVQIKDAKQRKQETAPSAPPAPPAAPFVPEPYERDTRPEEPPAVPQDPPQEKQAQAPAPAEHEPAPVAPPPEAEPAKETPKPPAEIPTQEKTRQNIEQLRSLKEYCRAMDESDTDDGSRVWQLDIYALDEAISALELILKG